MTVVDPVLDEYATARSRLLADIAAQFEEDRRVVAAWLTGSLGRGNADAISDIDITIVLTDETAEILCQRPHQQSGQTTAE